MIDKIAKNLLLNKTCLNCAYINLTSSENCVHYKYKPKEDTCEKWNSNFYNFVMKNISDEDVYIEDIGIKLCKGEELNILELDVHDFHVSKDLRKVLDDGLCELKKDFQTVSWFEMILYLSRI